MRLCIFGFFEQSDLYSRNSQMMNAVSDCFDGAFTVSSSEAVVSDGKFKHRSSLTAIILWALQTLRVFFELARHRKHIAQADAFFLPYPSYFSLLALQFLSAFRRDRPLIFVDAFLCLYDTVVDDRNIAADGSLVSRIVRWLELRTLRSADLVFIDTSQQKTALANRYGLAADKFVVTPVGIDESIWQPVSAPAVTEAFKVVFWGTFIPLHGIETIVAAARIVATQRPEIQFRLIGDGQTAEAILSTIEDDPLPNTVWTRQLISGQELQQIVKQSHCVLGIFGVSRKAGDVIPYKACQALASNRPLISRSGPAMSELTAKMEISGLYLVEPGDHQALASAIVRLFDNYNKVVDQVETALLYRKKLSSEVLFKSVSEAIATVLTDSGSGKL